MDIRVTSGFAPFSNVVDRFLPSGYREGMSFEEQLQKSTEIEGLDSIGLDYPMQFEDPVKLRALLDRYGLKLSVLGLVLPVPIPGDPALCGVAVATQVWELDHAAVHHCRASGDSGHPGRGRR